MPGQAQSQQHEGYTLCMWVGFILNLAVKLAEGVGV